jgi:hypothetical protein
VKSLPSGCSPRVRVLPLAAGGGLAWGGLAGGGLAWGSGGGPDGGDHAAELAFDLSDFVEERPGQQGGEPPKKSPPGKGLDDALEQGEEGFDRGEGRIGHDVGLRRMAAPGQERNANRQGLYAIWPGMRRRLPFHTSIISFARRLASTQVRHRLACHTTQLV